MTNLFLGVHYQSSNGQYRAVLPSAIAGRRIHISIFPTDVEAAYAVDLACKLLGHDHRNLRPPAIADIDSIYRQTVLGRVKIALFLGGFVYIWKTI